MTDDDRKIDADDSTLDAIRKLARAADPRPEQPEPEQSSTEQSSTEQPSTERPVDSVDDTPPALPRVDAYDLRRGADSQPSSADTASSPAWSASTTAPAATPVATPAASQPPPASPAVRREAATPATPWRPPPRSVRPSDYTAPKAAPDRRWQIAVVVLAVAVVALLAAIVLGGGDGGGDDDPSPDDPIVTSVPIESGELDPSDGGAGG